MENNRKKDIVIIWLISIVVILALCVAVYLLVSNSQKENQNIDQSLIAQERSTGTPINKIENLEIKRIMYRIPSATGTGAGDLISVDLENKNPVNLTKKLGLGENYNPHIFVNRDVSKIAYVDWADNNLSVWKADSDGSSSIEIFRTNNTGCNLASVQDVSDDGYAVIMMYGSYYEGDIGTCVPRSEPEISVSGMYYLKDGAELKYISSSIPDNDGNSNTIVGFYGNHILVNQIVANKFHSVSVMDPNTLKLTKLFDVPAVISSSSWPQLFMSPESSGKAIFSGGIPSNLLDPYGESKIGVFDYKNGSFKEISVGGWAEYQGVVVSPNLKNFIYQKQSDSERSGLPHKDYYVYNMEKNESKLLPFSGKNALHVLWKDDNSFVYRFPLDGSYPPSGPGVARLFDMQSFDSKLLFGPVSAIMVSQFMSL